MRGLLRKAKNIESAEQRQKHPNYVTFMLRGGRMTKVAGVAASFAPTLGSLGTGVSAIALGAALSVGGASSAWAGACLFGPMAGSFVCTLPADSGTDVTQSPLSGPAGLTVTTAPGFGIDTSVSGGNAINLTSPFDVVFDDQNESDITAAGIGLYGGNTSGSLTVTATGVVTGGTFGLYLTNAGAADGGDTTVTVSNDMGTAEARGGINGIDVFNYNSGSLSVTADNAYGGTGNGILAVNPFFGTGSELSVTTFGTVEGGANGIYAYSGGFSFSAGMMTITSVNDDGTASVTGGIDGINAVNLNGGPLSITVDRATGTTGRGVNAYNAGPGSASLSITVNETATGGTYGVRAFNFGMGDMTVTSTNDAGTNTVMGGIDGILANNYNGGALSITAHHVTGTTNDGISSFNDPLGTSLSVTTTGDVEGGDEGIDVTNFGSGDLTVMATNASGTASVTGEDKGIDAVNYNGGALSVTVDHATATDEDDAVYAYNDGDGTTSSVTVRGDAIGATNGIYAAHYGTGSLTVSVSGMTEGTTGSGIDTFTGLGGMTRINVNSGANVSGGTYAILNGPGDSMTYFNSSSTVSGVTLLGPGSDDLTIRNSDISGATVLDGGDDTSAADGFIDVLTFDGFSGTIGADLLNWEEAIFDNSDASFTKSMLVIPMVTLQNNAVFTPTQPDFNLTGDLMIDGTSRFNAGFSGMGTAMVDGDVVNNGEIYLNDDATGDVLTVKGDFSGTGNVGLDVDISDGSADRLSIMGNSSGSGGIKVNGFGTTAAPDTIVLVDVAGTSSASDFSLAEANFTTLEGEDAQVIGAFTYTLGFDGPAGEFFITPFDANGNLMFNPAVAGFEAYPNILSNLNNLPSTFQSWTNRSNGSESGGVTRMLFDFSPSPENAIWFNFSGGQTRYEGRSTTGATVEAGLTQFELGMDFPIFEGESGRLIAGASFSYQDAGTDVTSALAFGSINTNGQSLTLSSLWLSDSLFYANGQLRYSSFDTDMFLSGVGPVALGAQGEGFAASIEVGQAFAVSERLTLVPQFQLVHSSVSGNAIADPFGSGSAALITDGDTMTARVGVHAERATTSGSLFGSLSLIHAFDNETAVTFAGTTFLTNPDDQRLEITAGGQHNIGENSVIYGGLTATGGLNGFDHDYSYGLTAGLRINF